MAIMIADGFDFYNSQTDLIYVGSPWAGVAANGALSNTITPYGVGQSYSCNGTGMTSIQTATNETTIYIALDMYSIAAFTGSNANGCFITLMDVAANQVTLHWAMDGNFYVRAGGTGGTILNGSGWPHGMAAASWINWQAQVVINNTTGSVTLRKNNNPANDYQITNINTRNGSTNNYANKVALFSGTGGGITFYIDNFFMNSATAPAPTSWVGQVRAVQLMAAGDTATKAFTPSAGASAVIGTNSTTGSGTASANTIYWVPIANSTCLTGIGGTATNIIVKLASALTGNMNCALYATASGAYGAPSTLVAQATAITNPVLGDNTFTFPSPPTITDNVAYWIAIWCSAAASVNWANAGASNAYTQALTYTGTFPSTPAPVLGSVAIYSARLTISPVSNYGMVNELTMNSDTDYVTGSTAGNVDLYTMQQLTTVPANIVAVVTRVSMRKSDTGARTACTEINSGGTIQDQASFNLATTYGWQNVYFPTDPNTSAAWTYAAVNALQVGAKILT